MSEGKDASSTLEKMRAEAGSVTGGGAQRALEVHAGLVEEGFEPCDEGWKPLGGGRYLPDGWDGSGIAGVWTFWYRHPRSGLKYTAKVAEIGGKVVVMLEDGTEAGDVLHATLSKDTSPNLRRHLRACIVEKALPTSGPRSSGPTPHIPGSGPVPPPAAPSRATHDPPTNPAYRYGRGDLMPGHMGGNLLGPEAFRGRGGIGGGGGGGIWTPDGFFNPDGPPGPDGPMRPPPPGARYDPIHPDDPTLAFQGKGRIGGPFGPGAPGPGPFGGMPDNMFM